VAEGLSRAWNNDLDGAITAFDAAIALQPRLAFAYLNRGLAYQRLGEADRALADLNRAVRYAPYAARGYYARSLIFRQKGDVERARADEESAVQRDAQYGAVVE
jgi:tetratricopeptide (TPR) repeat protein